MFWNFIGNCNTRIWGFMFVKLRYVVSMLSNSVTVALIVHQKYPKYLYSTMKHLEQWHSLEIQWGPGRFLETCFSISSQVITYRCCVSTEQHDKNLILYRIKKKKPKFNTDLHTLFVCYIHYYYRLTLRRLMSYIYIWSTHSWCF